MKIDNSYIEKLKKRAAAPKPRGIHSYTHQVVKDVCDWFGQGYKEFGIWLGIATRNSAGELKAKLDALKSDYGRTGDQKYKDPKYLMGCMRSRPVDKYHLTTNDRTL